VKWLRHPGVYRAVAIALGALFVYASVDKIASPQAFAKIVYHYGLVGPSRALGYTPANLVAIVLPWLELVCGLLLIGGFWRREAAALTALMLVVFIGAVGWALAHGIDIANCGCFSVSGEGRGAGLKLILGDLGLLAAAVYLVVLPPRRDAPARVGAPAPAL
jgi:putative oxidoreductase